MTTDWVAGLLLAGGLSRRMGVGDKSLLVVEGESLLARVVERARPQVGTLLLNANGDPQRFSAFGLPVIADSVGGFAGPLAGVLTGLEWVRDNLPGVEWMASFATDTPFFPTDLVARLAAAVTSEGADIGCAMSDGNAHPVFALWPVRLAGALRHALVDEDLHKIYAWTARYRVAVVTWPGGESDPFFNVNTPEQLERLRARLQRADRPEKNTDRDDGVGASGGNGP
jgi:molybdenum cofactor guanylyltransferase